MSKLFYSLLLSTFLIISLSQSPTVTSSATPAVTTSSNVTTSNRTVTTTTVVTPQGGLVPAPQPIVNISGQILPQLYCLSGSNNSFLDFGSAVGDFGTGDFTVAIWLQTNTTLPLFDIVGNRYPVGFGNYFGMRMAGVNPNITQGVVIVEVCENAAGLNYANLISTKSGLNDGNWHHLAAVRSGTVLSLYVDGVLDNNITTTGAANINTTTPFVVGRSAEPIAGVQFAPTACYEALHVYNAALVASDIAQLSAASSS